MSKNNPIVFPMAYTTLCGCDAVRRTNLQGASTHITNLYVTHAAGAAAYCTHRPVLMPRERRHDFVRWLPRSVNIHNNAH